MRTLVLDAPAPIDDEPLAPRDVPVPRPDRGQVRLRVTVCGV